jgi:hypothetical protein
MAVRWIVVERSPTLDSVHAATPCEHLSDMKPLGFLILAAILLAGDAQAQDAAQGSSRPRPAQPPTVQEVKGAAGRDIRIMVLTNLKPDCTSGPLPNIRLVTPPANGKIAVRRVRLNATNVRQCLAVEIPALVAFYRSAPEFEGSDTVMVEIRPNEGPPIQRRVDINVSKQAPEIKPKVQEHSI